MDLIIDASSIINLDDAHALDLVAGLRNKTLWLSPLVIGECEPTCAAEILRLKALELIRFVDPEDIPAELFLELLADHELGEGETECLALCLMHPYVLCCDDSKARRVAVSLFGEPRVIGSLRLLKWLVVQEVSSAQSAFELYQAMKTAGGFLPTVDLAWFTQGED